MTVGEALLGAFITVLLEKLSFGAGTLLRLVRPEGIVAQLKKCRRLLLVIQQVLGDAEDRQYENDVVKEWLEELHGLAYDLDDVVDELVIVASQRDLMEAKEISRRFSGVVSSLASSFGDFKVDLSMTSKVEGICEKLGELADQVNYLGLKSFQKIKRTKRRSQTTSLIYESRVFGRDEDKQYLLKLLLTNESSNGQVSVVPIVGMGGIGKTTLAQLVYNDEMVKVSFDLRVWVCVSEDYDIQRITRTILRAICSDMLDYEDLNLLQVKLLENLSNKRYLLVLDDIWNDNYEDWDQLRSPLYSGSNGSKIIVTTRIGSVASTMSSLPPYYLHGLSDNDCLSILAQHALEVPSFQEYPDLKDIAEQIVAKCKHLPLALKTVGGLLRRKSLQDWKDILTDQIWGIGEQSLVLPALRLSYRHLQSHLKQCFAFCSIFPKGYKFEKSELILLWIAEGFVRKPKGEKFVDLAKLGDMYFNQLVSRSFFQKSSGIGAHFTMHDLLNDLAKYVAGDIHLNMDDELELEFRYNIYEKVRHSTFNRSQYEVSWKFNALPKFSGLRTFLPLPIEKLTYDYCHFSPEVLLKVLPKLKHLRVLSLSGYAIHILPDSIGDLKHLRYLNLSRTKIELLPETLGSLFNLQTLSVSHCRELKNLPACIKDLINLRHLDNSSTDQLREMPQGMAQLSNLQTLPKIVLRKGRGFKLDELGFLPLLRGSLSIQDLQYVMNIQDARKADLKGKKYLDELRFAWSNNVVDARNEDIELSILDALQPSINLRSLDVDCYGGIRFPRWIGDFAFAKLGKISLRGCKRCTSLPPLGQLPFLIELLIQGMDQLETIGAEFYGDVDYPFASLENLIFQDMPRWETWSNSNLRATQDGSLFSQLRILQMHRCPRLISMPLLEFPSLRRLDLADCMVGLLRTFYNVTSLVSLNLHVIKGLTFLNEVLQFPTAVEDLWISDCPVLVILWPSYDAALSQEAGIVPPMLKSLKVSNCPALRSSPMIRNFVNLDIPGQLLPSGRLSASLQKLIINGSAEVVWSTMLEDCFMSLESLSINGWENMNFSELLPWFQQKFSSLHTLNIDSCDKLEYFPEGGLDMPHLREIKISNCRYLKSLPSQIGTHSLLKLSLHDCPTLECFPIGNFCPTLRYLEIHACLNLKSLPDHISTLSLVENLELLNCPRLSSFPQGNHLPRLESFTLSKCRNIKSLPSQMESLTSLRNLRLNECPRLETFPHGDLSLPPSLENLEISYCDKLNPLSEWGLFRLNSLQSFTLRGGNSQLVNFTSSNGTIMFPSSLTHLSISELPCLETISDIIWNLSSLQWLLIVSCPKLSSLPIDELFESLWCLDVSDCRLLRKWYFKNKRQVYWMINHIPYAKIDLKSFHELGSAI